MTPSGDLLNYVFELCNFEDFSHIFLAFRSNSNNRVDLEEEIDENIKKQEFNSLMKEVVQG
jgi:hypothetical protein